MRFHVRKGDMSKMYISNVSNRIVKERFHSFTSNLTLEIVKIKPRPDMDIKDVFFKEHKPFSYYYSHTEFKLETVSANFTLEDILNFAVSDELVSLCETSEDVVKHKLYQSQLLSGFTNCYSSYHCKDMHVMQPTSAPETTATYELIQKRILVEKIMHFGPPSYSIYEELMVRSSTGISLGNIDIVSCDKTSDRNAINVLAIKCCDEVHSDDRQNIITTSAKTESTYSDPGSDRQVVVEILTLSKVFCRVEFLILLKATTNKFRPYIYFPNDDILIRVKQDVPFDVKMKTAQSDEITASMMGCFVFFLLLRYTVNSLTIDKIKEQFEGAAAQCGWKKAVEHTNISPFLQKQQYSMKKHGTTPPVVEDSKPRKIMKLSPVLDLQ